jgi:hypothetical protein
MEAVARFFQALSPHLPYQPHKGSGFASGRGLPRWDRKKIIFAMGSFKDRRHHVLTRLGVRERLLSYFDLREASAEDIETYAPLATPS